MAWIGTSGWSYDHWDDVLYHGAPSTRWLGLYAERFRTVELNAGYHHWQPDERFATWRDRLPEGFRMAVKAPRGVCHPSRFRDPGVWVERITRGLAQLGAKRGPLLVQLSPAFTRDDDALEAFLTALPEWTAPVLEFRSATWAVDPVFEILERHRASSCVMSGAGLPCILRATSDVVYVRWHGPDPDHLYGGSYSDDDLAWWADRIREWEQQGRQVYGYFNNDGGGDAVRNAQSLTYLLGER